MLTFFLILPLIWGFDLGCPNPRLNTGSGVLQKWPMLPHFWEPGTISLLTGPELSLGHLPRHSVPFLWCLSRSLDHVHRSWMSLVLSSPCPELGHFGWKQEDDGTKAVCFHFILPPMQESFHQRRAVSLLWCNSLHLCQPLLLLWGSYPVWILQYRQHLGLVWFHLRWRKGRRQSWSWEPLGKECAL